MCKFTSSSCRLTGASIVGGRQAGGSTMSFCWSSDGGGGGGVGIATLDASIPMTSPSRRVESRERERDSTERHDLSCASLPFPATS